MKVFLVLLLIPALSLAQEKVDSKAYSLADIRTNAIHGSTTLLQSLEIHTDIVEQGQTHDCEELVIIYNGSVKASIGKDSRVLGPGSIVYVMPGVEHGFVNAGETPCSYYIIRLKKSLNPTGNSATSFMVDWNEMKFVPHDKGGRRNVVDKPTKLFERFEMHVTTLNPGLSSHDPHSHTPEEIILIKEGDVEMNVGEKKPGVSKGGLVFLDSKISHNLTNVGTAPTTYFAFQWN